MDTSVFRLSDGEMNDHARNIDQDSKLSGRAKREE